MGSQRERAWVPAAAVLAVLLSARCQVPPKAAHRGILHSVSLIERQQPTSDTAPPQAGCDRLTLPAHQELESEGRGDVAVMGERGTMKSMLGTLGGCWVPLDCGAHGEGLGSTSTCLPPPGLCRLGGRPGQGRPGGICPPTSRPVWVGDRQRPSETQTRASPRM